MQIYWGSRSTVLSSKEFNNNKIHNGKIPCNSRSTLRTILYNTILLIDHFTTRSGCASSRDKEKKRSTLKYSSKGEHFSNVNYIFNSAPTGAEWLTARESKTQRRVNEPEKVGSSKWSAVSQKVVVGDSSGSTADAAGDSVTMHA